eukprot:Gb_09342 [translate_table: standard]
MLVTLAAEEAVRVEAMAKPPYTSSVTASRQRCAICLTAATTRCSRCKAVRYCFKNSRPQAENPGEPDKLPCHRFEPLPRVVRAEQLLNYFNRKKEQMSNHNLSIQDMCSSSVNTGMGILTWCRGFLFPPSAGEYFNQ